MLYFLHNQKVPIMKLIMKLIRGKERLHIHHHLKIITVAGYTDVGILLDSNKNISVSIKRTKNWNCNVEILDWFFSTHFLEFLHKSLNYLIEEFTQRCSVKFRKIHKKTLVLESLLQALRPVNLLKKTLTKALSCEFCEIIENTYFVEHLRTTATANLWR